MKRFIKEAVEYVDWWYKKRKNFRKVFSCIGIIFAILMYMVMAVAIDTKPAEQSDYDELIVQALEIHNNPELLPENAYHDTNGMIKLELENEECKIFVRYDEDFKIILITQEDKAEHFLVWTLVTILICYATWLCTYIGLTVLLAMFDIIYAETRYLIKKE